MKKFLAMMLAVLMLLSMATVAFADGGTSTAITYTTVANGGKFTLKKAYINFANAPKETFTFTSSVANDSPEGTPELESVTFKKAETPTEAEYGKIEIDLPTYSKVGKYVYTISEEAGSTKGVHYDTTAKTLTVQTVYDNNELKCLVYVSDGSNKIDTITNEYKDGTLKITKVVDSYFDADDTNCNYHYSFNASLSSLNASQTYTGYIYDKAGQKKTDSQGNPLTVTVTADTNGSSEISFDLDDGDYLQIEHLPENTGYEVTEEALSDAEKAAGTRSENVWEYDSTTAHSNFEKKISAGTTDTVTVTNKFNYHGDLVIKKIVGGNFGDKENDTFTFTVTIAGNYTPETTGGATCTSSNGVYTLTMKHGASVTFKNVPYGTTYTVKETTPYSSVSNALKEYKKDATDATNTKNSAEGKGDECSDKVDFATEEVTFTNTNEQTPETGVSLDTLPYVLVLALAGAGLVLMIARKRRVQD